MRPVAFLIALLVTAATALGQATRPTTVPADRGDAVVVVADGMVDNFMRDSLAKRFDQAEAAGADAIILSINTYGGLVTAGLEISRDIKQRQTPIYAYVDDKAISAGSMIALAAQGLAMEPASQIGDSGVIAMGQGELGETERAKAESPVLADFDDSARRNGYDPLVARSFVRTDAVVYAIQPTGGGDVRFVDREDYEQLTAQDGGYEDVPDVPVPLDDEESLLTLGNQAAEAIGLSMGTYASAEDYARSLGFAVMTRLEPSAGDRVVGFLSSFTIRGLLMTVLFLSVYASFNAPGTGVPEVIAVSSLTILFGVPYLTGFAEWYEVLFVLVGVGLVAIEAFVLPGFGIFGISGLVSILLGLGLTFVGPIFPQDIDVPAGFGVDWARLGQGMLGALAAMVISLFLWLWLARFLPTLPYANQLLLKEQPPTPEEQARRMAWPTVGTVGTVVSDLRPGGTARFAITDAPGDTTNTDVVSDRGFVAAGQHVRVVEVAGNRVVVRPVKGAHAE